MPEITKAFSSIKDYYNFVDSIKFNSIELMHFINVFREKAINLNDEDKQNIELEINCLQFRVQNGEIKPLYVEETENGNKVVFPNIDLIKENEIEYLKKRYNSVFNIYFKTRFAHIIWHKTKDFEYANNSIDSYFDLIDHFRCLDKEFPNGHFGIEVCYAIWNLQHLVLTINYKVKELQDLILDLINNPNEKSSFFLKLRLDGLKILIEKVKKKKFNSSILCGLEQICENTLSANLSKLFASDYFKTGEEISKLLKTDYKRWILKQAEYYEQLSNTENPIIAPEYCQKAIDLYKKLDNKTKLKELYNKYSFLSKSIKLNQYYTKPIDLTPCVKEYEKIAEELSSEELLKFIVYSSDIIPNYNRDKEFIEKQNEQYWLSSLFHTKIIDEYGHVIGKLDTEEDELKHQMYCYCDIWYDIQSKIFSHFLKKSIELKKMNAKIVLEFLSNTWYGANIEKKLSGGNNYKYNWLQYIGPSIESFFLKFEKFIQGDTTSILYIQEIDSLSLKIEGMIRDMILLADIDDFHLFYFDKNENFNWRNINQYLKDSSIVSIIPENDAYFLKYFLTEHRNLRNRVAHSLTFLGEYGIYNMVILFIAILRLSKCLVLKREMK